jgi:hypothetical protein
MFRIAWLVIAQRSPFWISPPRVTMASHVATNGPQRGQSMNFSGGVPVDSIEDNSGDLHMGQSEAFIETSE